METSELQQVVADARDIVTARRVYGEPYEKNGLTVIPAASVRGAVGGGTGQHGEEDAGIGGGFGVTARPVGAWVIRGEEAIWQPAIDVNRIVAGGQLVALAAMLVVGRVMAGHRPRRRRRGLRLELKVRPRDVPRLARRLAKR